MSIFSKRNPRASENSIAADQFITEKTNPNQGGRKMRRGKRLSDAWLPAPAEERFFGFCSFRSLRISWDVVACAGAISDRSL